MDEKSIRSHDLLSRQSGTAKLKEGKHTSVRAHPLLASLRTTVVAKPCLALCDPMDCSTPGFLVLHYLLEFSQFMSFEASLVAQTVKNLPAMQETWI